MCVYVCVSMFLADILLIQSNTGTPADLLELCPGGQPVTEKKKRENGNERERYNKWQVLNISSLATCKPI